MDFNRRSNLSRWVINNKPIKNIPNVKKFWDYIEFLDSEILPLFVTDMFSEIDNHVIGGKSVCEKMVLPIITFNYYDFRITIRTNLNVYIVSVITPSKYKGELYIPDSNLFDPNETPATESIVSNSYNANHRSFVVVLRNNYKLYTFLFLLKREISQLYIVNTHFDINQLNSWVQQQPIEQMITNAIHSNLN